MRSLLSAVLACAVHYALAMYGLDHAELHHRSSCTPIPTDLYLCRGIEYARMRLPNLLGHETLSEAAQQAAAWVPLVHKHCHTDTRKFLCSLFAPVCLEDLDEPIQPCRSLCEAVRSACAPVMAAFGFPWPEMLECTRFPEDNDLCIPPAPGDTETPGPVAHGGFSTEAGALLVMGQNLDGNLVITSLKRWQKGQREIKRLYRSIRKLQC